MIENPDFLTTQIITYIGNKRSLLSAIETEVITVQQQLGCVQCVCADLFSGSGIVARMLKSHSSHLIVNDLEDYSSVVNSCYLSNKSDFDRRKYLAYRKQIETAFNHEKKEGLIARYYAPKNDDCIAKNERVFYTRDNALRIDTYRTLIDEYVTDIEMKKYFLAPLITAASIHTNTSGVFKGFYKDKNTGKGCFGGVGKNALSRILGTIELDEPIFSNFESTLELHQEDAVTLAGKLKNLDITYLDPPYNQHPYGSNYFMLNLILKNHIDSNIPVSKVSGILADWNRSVFNKKQIALASLQKVISLLDSRFVIISYNSEGFITFNEMIAMLQNYGSVTVKESLYATFRGCRNLHNRSVHVSEYLFTLQKK